MKSVIRMGLCAAVLWGGAALAQDDTRVGSRTERDRAERVRSPREGRGADEGFYVLLGGGAAGYTGELAPAINPGPAYGAVLGYRPSKVLGVELSYNGSVHDIDLGRGEAGGGVTDGADIIRNGAQAAATIGLSTTKLQPYVLGGIGIDAYNVRGGQGLNFDDDTTGYVPAGLGLRYQFGRLITADARVSYNVLFNQDFAPVQDNSLADGRYQALLQLGGTY